MSQRTDNPAPKTLTDLVRHQTRGLTAQLGKQIGQLGVTPNAITLVGLIPVAAAALLCAGGYFAVAGILLIVGAPLDALDGAVARAMNLTSRFGALLDSTTDRYADGMLFFGLAYYYASHAQMLEMVIAGCALIGAYGVSYARARAEGLGIGSIKDGLFDRMVRTILLIAALITGWVVPGLVILAIGNNVTAIQRVLAAYRATRNDTGENPT